MRRPLLLVFALVAALVLAGCPQDSGSRRAASTTTTRRQPTTTTTTPGPVPGTPGGPGPGSPPDDLPRAVLLGGAKLTSVDLGSGRSTDIPNPRLQNGLQVVGLLDRAYGAMVLVRGPLP